MPKRSSKGRKDLNQLAASIVAQATGEEEEQPKQPEKNPAAVALWRLGVTDINHEDVKLSQVGGGNGGGGDNLDPLISGLVKRLPAPGTIWSIGARVKWLQAAANNFDLIFETDAADSGKTISISSQDESGGPV